MVNKDELLYSIRNNFLKHNLTIDKDNLVYPYEGDTEREEIQKFYYNMGSWQNVLKNKNKIHGSHISFLTPIAIAQYIPAFMLYCIEDPENADILISFLTWFLLGKNSINDYCAKKELESFYHYLSNRQQETIMKYLEYMCDKYPEDC